MKALKSSISLHWWPFPKMHDALSTHVYVEEMLLSKTEKRYPKVSHIITPLRRYFVETKGGNTVNCDFAASEKSKKIGACGGLFQLFITCNNKTVDQSDPEHKPRSTRNNSKYISWRTELRITHSFQKIKMDFQLNIDMHYSHLFLWCSKNRKYIFFIRHSQHKKMENEGGVIL